MEFIVDDDFNLFLEILKNKSSHDKIMYINIFVNDEDDGDLKRLYIGAAENHNKKILEDPHFYDAGFDLYLPKNSNKNDILDDGTRFFSIGWENNPIPVNKVDFKVKCCAKIYDGSRSYFTPFYTYARSSLSKTPLRLANNQGIIDAGYRGNLIGMFDCIYNIDNSSERLFDWYMEKYTRMLQICAPALIPIYVNIVNSIEELGPTTLRGQGGFGSTGK